MKKSSYFWTARICKLPVGDHIIQTLVMKGYDFWCTFWWFPLFYPECWRWHFRNSTRKMNGLVVVLVIVTVVQVVVKSMNDSTFYEKDSSMLMYKFLEKMESGKISRCNLKIRSKTEILKKFEIENLMESNLLWEIDRNWKKIVCKTASEFTVKKNQHLPSPANFEIKLGFVFHFLIKQFQDIANLSLFGLKKYFSISSTGNIADIYGFWQQIFVLKFIYSEKATKF